MFRRANEAELGAVVQNSDLPKDGLYSDRENFGLASLVSLYSCSKIDPSDYWSVTRMKLHPNPAHSN